MQDCTFRNFIIITITVPLKHDSVIRRETAAGALAGSDRGTLGAERSARTTAYLGGARASIWSMIRFMRAIRA